MGEFAVVFVVAALGAVHGEAPLAAYAEVVFVEGVGEAVGAPPLLEEFGVGPGFVHGIYGKWDDSCAADFAVGGGGVEVLGFHFGRLRCK